LLIDNFSKLCVLLCRAARMDILLYHKVVHRTYKEMRAVFLFIEDSTRISYSQDFRFVWKTLWKEKWRQI